MDIKKVKSSNVTSIGYDKETKVLAVTFSSGGTYHYQGVNQETFSNLIKAKSIGGFLHSHIKPNHKCNRCEDE